MITRRKETLVTHAAAAACTGAILFFFARLLLYVPPPRAPAPVPSADRLQVYFLAQPRAAEPTVEPPVQPPARAQRHASAPVATAVAKAAPPQRTGAAPADPALSTQLYTREGRLRLPREAQIDPLAAPGAVPPGMTDERALAQARKLMEPPTPVQYQGTRFAKDWKSDGTLGDVAVQEMTRGMKKFNDMINGPQTQTARARPPPDVRFNPALAQNQVELGSAATGDAYKAAPIAHEPLPDLLGGASQRIREALASLEQRSARCAPAVRTSLLAPVRTHLGDLERAEHALNHGADPVMAAQLLPRQADSAYDLARRALWYADRQLTQCMTG
ncbi:hypothetical protein [Xanthomonas maliensis]|uniref:hypothetical protein n=1 Tax=Xanthomonas maliensis TaxID=1321368 RepID=UPI00039EF51E|nr:hypothetical protein [Xanthomonas maliensis]KAB7767298.1 hypothetical protein CKY51_11925 [Xanthomonas maliensis]